MNGKSTEILTERRGAVLAIAFHRPEKKNALTAGMYAAMAQAVAAAEADAGVRVVLFHGAPDVFTSGNDIEDFLERPPTGENPPVFRFLQAVSHAAKPIVAAVNGPAVGLGTTLLLHCELVYAGDNARFVMPFTSLGLVPEFASSYLLPLVAGYPRAAEWLLLGEPFGPAEALAAGLVTRVVPAAQTLDVAWQAAERLAALPEKSVRLTKELLKSAHREQIDRQLATEGRHFLEMLGEPAARAALAAFMQRRKR
jgi:enoyl-CoA hydratase/carnithine racemase